MNTNKDFFLGFNNELNYGDFMKNTNLQKKLIDLYECFFPLKKMDYNIQCRVAYALEKASISFEDGLVPVEIDDSKYLGDWSINSYGIIYRLNKDYNKMFLLEDVLFCVNKFGEELVRQAYNNKEKIDKENNDENFYFDEVIDYENLLINKVLEYYG